MHHPKNWTFNVLKEGKKEKPIFLPKLTRFVCKAGVNGVGGTQDAPDTRTARVQFQDQGFTLLDPEKYNYLSIYPAIGGEYICNKWTTLESIGGKILTNHDNDSFAKWRMSLVADGTLKPPHDQILELEIRKLQDLITMHDSKPHIPQAVGASQAASERLVQMQKAKEAIKKNGVSYYE
tara:strand:- start:557 stop:1093 length:537 start_codon:yes stop_codon:yes gene_type:complete